MLRFFEPEMETGWPFSAATLDFNPFLAIRRDSIFPFYPSSSLELLFSSEISHSGNDGFSCEPSSNTVTGLNSPLDYKDNDSFQLGSRILIYNKDNEILQLENSSPPTTRNSLSLLNSFPASEKRTADLIMTPKESIAPTDVGRAQKMNKMQESKRRKFSLYPSRSSEGAAMSPAWLAKSPTRTSQKIRDRVTALQQLVSPYGKTDTASVLNEASICIKALHEQIQMLTTPYIGGERYGLLRNGLCLAPITPTIVSLINHAELDRFTDK